MCIRDSTGGDEDDADPAEFLVETFDLALIKLFNPAASEFPILQNRLVTFEIQIANQGTVDATEIELTDYIPAGLTLEDTDWTASNGIAVFNQLLNIAAGQTESVMITFRVDTGISGTLINETEISSARDEFGAEVEDCLLYTSPSPRDS